MRSHQPLLNYSVEDRDLRGWVQLKTEPWLRRIKIIVPKYLFLFCGIKSFRTMPEAKISTHITAFK